MREGKARYRFTVNDTGMGMPEEFLARIFDPFSRSRAAAVWKELASAKHHQRACRPDGRADSGGEPGEPGNHLPGGTGGEIAPQEEAPTRGGAVPQPL